jgi:hypothetical protein
MATAPQERFKVTAGEHDRAAVVVTGGHIG